MKKSFLNGLTAILFCTLFMMSSSLLVAQNDEEIPSPVLTSFEEMFPNAEDPFWQDEGAEFKVTFYEEDSVSEAFFGDDGTWNMTMTDIEIDALPEVASTYVYDFMEQDGELMVSIVKAEMPAKVEYRVNFESETESISMKFDQYGKLLKKDKKNF